MKENQISHLSLFSINGSYFFFFFYLQGLLTSVLDP